MSLGWLAGLAVAAAPAVVWAQSPEARLVSVFQPRAPIRVSIAGARLVGEFGGVVTDSLVMTQDGIARRLRLAELTGVWRRGNAVKTGAIVGGVAGVLGGAFLGVIVAGVCDAAECPDLTTNGIVGGLAGGAIGAGAGALVGAAIPQWRRVAGFPR